MAISSTVKSIGEYFSKLRGKKATFDKVAILTDAEEIVDTLKVLSASIRTSGTADALQSICSNPRPVNDQQRAIASTHTIILNNLESQLQRKERVSAFSIVADLADAVASDVELIRTKYDMFFGPAHEADIDPRNVRMSMALAIGFLAQAYDLCSWGTHLISVAGAAVGGDSAPPYQVKGLSIQAVTIARFANDILGRSHGRTIADVVAEMKRRGTDVFADTGSETVADYAVDSDYSPAAQKSLARFTVGPLNMKSGIAGITARYNKYQGQKEMREFMQARVALLTMQMSHIDPTSAEYRRLESIVKHYAVKIAQEDKRIADYEAG